MVFGILNGFLNILIFFLDFECVTDVLIVYFMDVSLVIKFRHDLKESFWYFISCVVVLRISVFCKLKLS